MKDVPIRLVGVSEPAADTRSLYDQVGQESGVRALVDRFYDLMDLEPDLAPLRALHRANLDGTRDLLYWFLCGYLGGPDHYVSRFGHPRLRARHLHVPIGESERDLWMTCMGRAMQDRHLPQPLIDTLLEAFYRTADWMRNRAG